MPQAANDVKLETIRLWLDAALRQVAAESYFHGIALNSNEALTQRLTRGNTPLESNQDQYVRLTQSHAASFLAEYEIVDHHANDASGFSATVLRRKATDPITGAQAGEYTLAFRSTEYKNPSQGGDFDRDGFLYAGLLRADGEIARTGFAQGQLAAMEAYYQQLKLGITSTDPDNSAQLNTLGKVNTSLRDFFGNASSTFNVVGYSLGAHLATVFTERHGDVVSQAFTFNAAGRGALGGTTPGSDTARLEDMYAYFVAVLLNPNAGGDPRRLPVPRGGSFDQTGIDLYRAAKGLVQSVVGQGFDPFKLDPSNLATDSTRRNLYVDARYRWAAYATIRKFSPFQPGTSETGKDITLSTDAFAKITQLFGHANFGDKEVTANSGVHAPTTSIFIEAQPFLEGLLGGRMPFAPELTRFLDGKGDFGNTHSLTLVIDSLTVMEAFMTADAALTKRQVETILSGGSEQRARAWGADSSTDSNAEGDSLELPLDRLRKLYGAQGVRYVGDPGAEREELFDYGVAPWSTPVSRANGGFGDAGNRRVLHRNIELLKDKIAEKGGATIASLVPESQFQANNGEPIAASVGLAVQTIIGKAKQRDAEGLAYRYALRELNPFVVTGNAALYSIALQNELSFYDPSTGTGALSDQWIDDRAKLLAYELEFNVFNKQFDKSPNPFGGELLQDLATNTRVTLLSNLQLASARTYDDMRDRSRLERYLAGIDYQRRTLFGEDDPTNRYEDNVSGWQSVDRLYGGLGNDRLDGKGGADYLDGGVGNDQIDGGAADDRLLGGAGEDTLRGGQGYDTYIWRRGDGFDTIIDYSGDDFGGDGLGKIESLGVDLSGDKTLANPEDNDRLFEDTDYLYAFTGDTGSRGTLTIAKKNEASGFGGMRIEGFKNGDLGINLVGLPTFVKTDLQGTGGNDTVSIFDSFARFFGFAGNDRIQVAGVQSEALGGIGDDFLLNDDGDQILRGEEGRDILLASGGNDKLYGGTESDALQGGEGDDLLEGDEGDDVLDGGLGSDVINGGPGNDFLVGGGSLVVGAPWSAESVPVFGALVVAGQPTGVAGMTGSVAIDGDEGDVIDGGPGNDTVFAGSGDDFVHGGDDDDLISGDAGSDTLSGGDGADALFGDATQGSITIGGQQFFTLPDHHGNDVLIGGAGNDTLQGDGGADELLGGEGDDLLIGDAALLDEQFHGADYLDGGDGNDVLLGYGKGDSLFGGAGDDTLGGDSNTIADSLHGDDYLDGEDGNDTLHGDGGADRLFGGAGDDILDGDASDVAFEFHGDDYLDGEDGNDALQGGGGSDQLFGGAGNDSLVGDGPGVPVEFAGADYLDGEAGNDVLEGGAGDDTLIGGPGNDILRGQAGDDLYIVTTGDQQDFIDDREGSNTLRLDSATFAGITIGQATGSDGNAYLSLRYGTTDVAFVRDGLVNGSFRYEFSDGSSKTAADMRAEFELFAEQFGTSAADTMTGSALADFFFPGGGNDTIVFGRGSNYDRVSGFGQTPGAFSGLDVVRVVGGLTAADLDIQRGLSGELTLTIRDSGDVLRIDNWSSSASGAHAGNQVVFEDGSGLNAAGLIALALAPTAGADVLIGGTGPDTIDGGAGDDRLFGNNNANPVNAGADHNVLLGGDGNDVLQGGFGDDVLDGGTGDDALTGGAGADTFRWGLGDGNDTVTDAGSSDIVEIKAGLSPADLTLTQGSIAITVNATGETLTLSALVGELRFADGTVWDASMINEMANHATPFDDLLRGMATSDVLHGLDGNDVIDGFDGDDVLSGGDGTDTLIGGAGADELAGGAGDDVLDGLGGSDLLVGGPGDDLLNGGAGHDVYVFAPGDGIDRLLDVASAGLEEGSGHVIEFAAGIAPVDVDIRSDGATLFVDYGSGMVQVPLAGGDHYAHGIGLVRFADGTRWEDDALRTQIRIVPREFLGTAAAESFFGGGGADVIDAGAGDDTLVGNAGDDILDGGAGHDVLAGGEGNDALYGGEGLDTLGGGNGDDHLDGGPGNDQLNGGLGSDTYRFGLDTGHDSAFDAFPDPFLRWTRPGDLDVILVDPDLSPADVAVSRVGDNLLLETPGSASSLSMGNWFASELGLGPLAVRFADGTEWDSATLALLVGYVPAASLDDTLAGTPGNDVLVGGYGNDTYLFGFGSGNDTIQEPGNTLDGALNRATAGARDIIRFGPGVTPQDVRVAFNGIVPTFHLDATGDSLTVSSWSDVTGRVELAEFEDGTVWDLGRSNYWRADSSAGIGVPDIVTGSKRHFAPAQLGLHDELYLGGLQADLVSDFSGHHVFYGGAGNDSLSTGSGDDQLDGGAGNDSLSPGTGDNRIRFGRGFGQDTLHRSSAVENLGVETIVLGEEITPEQVRLRRGPSSALILELAGTPDALLINGPLRGIAGRDRLRLEFADGTLWGVDQIEAHIQTVALIEGGTGNNTLTGGEGDDLFIGGAGNDTITGGGGNDTYVFHRGDGSDTVNGRFPRIVFGEGIAPGDVTLTGVNFAFGQRNLQVTISGNGGQLTLFNWFDQLRIDGGFEFADGTVWDAAFVGARIPYAWTSGQSGFFFGTPGADAYSAGAANDTLRGQEGDDTLSGNAGNDQIFGGDGNDTLDGGAGDDALQGEAGDDSLSGGEGSDVLLGGAGDDTLLGGTGIDQLGGGAGADTLVGGDGDDLLEGGRGDDLLDGGAGDDGLYGGAGSDTYVFGLGSGRDTLLDYDGTGTDVDTVVLGEGIAAGNLVLTRRGGDILLTVVASGDSLAIRSFGRPGYGVERVLFADGSAWSGADLAALAPMAIAVERGDVIYGTENGDFIAGLGGDDFIDAGAGDDTLDGGSGDDILVGGAGNDVLQGGVGANHLTGGEGQDLFLTGAGFGSDSIADLGVGDTLRFGAGIAPAQVRIARDVDHLYLEVDSVGRFVTLENWFAQGSAGAVEFADGSAWDGAFLKATVDALTEGDDFIVGTDAADVIATLGGLDVVFAGDGDDHVSGGSGSDTLNGEAGDDVLLGEAGYDLLSGGAGNDLLDGGADDDALFGDDGNDLLLGGDGFDELAGGAGDDVLEGGAGDDVLNDGAGNDLLDGGAGDDLLQGGPGSDTYVFAAGYGADVIVDASSSTLDPNILRLTGIAPDAVSFKWFGTEFLMEIEGSADTLLLRDSRLPHLRAIDTIEFDDGTTWESFDMAQRTIRVGTEGDDNLTIAFRGLAGLGGNDVLTGGGGADLLDGGTGDDQLRGGLGGDTYVFKFGYGSDLIVENDSNTGNVDTIVFHALPSDVTVTKAGADVQFTLAGGADRLTVQGWFNGSAMQIEAVRFLDGTIWDAAMVTALATGQPLQQPGTIAGIAAVAETSTETGAPIEEDAAPAAAATFGLVAELTPAGDFFRGSGSDDVLDGLGGDDTLLGGPGNDELQGSEGDDYLVGEDGDDTLDGGVGRDILEGGNGNDRYVFGAGYGQDWVLDSGGIDEVVVDASIAPNAVTFTRDLSNLYLSAGADRLTLVNWFYRADTRIETFRFADGSSLDEAAVRLALQVSAASSADDTLFASDRGETLLGLAGEDTLYGEGGDDVLDGGTGSDYMLGGKGNDTYYVDNRLDRATEALDEGTDTVFASASYALAPHVENLVLTGTAPLSATGNDGNNVIDGNAGANTLRGGRGDDWLRGGAGNDAYLYDQGDGNDVVEDVDPTPGNADEVRFGQGITSSGVRVRRDDQDVRLVLLGGGEVRMRNWFDTAARIEAVRFADGTTWDAATIEFLANQPVNDPPVLSRPIDDLSTLEDEPLAHVLQPGTFEDPDAADTLTFAASRADGSELPGWLAFDSESATFSGLPGNADVGEYAIRVTATDSASQSASDEFVLTVINVNDAPELALPVGDQSVAVGAGFALSLEAGMFTDVDPGDELTYAATRADGSALPEWLVFDAASRSFSGTPAVSDAGPLDVRVTATDLAGVSASDEFRITVVGEEPSGKHLVGTSHGDVLVGTPYDDTIEGRQGRDLLIGLAGSDVIEGGKDDDLILGGKGDDVYLFARGDGDDLIIETGGHDVLRFGAGISRYDVAVMRDRGDLVLRLKGHGGSVTVRNWFDSDSRRLERVEFADGSSWGEAELWWQAKRHTLGGWSDDWHDWEWNAEKRRHHWHDRGSDGDRRRSSGENYSARDARALVARRLEAAARYDFGAVADYLRQQAEQRVEARAWGRVAGQWAAVQRAFGYLEQSHEEASHGAQDGRDRDHLPAHGDAGWGHASSTGRRHAYAGLQSFTGLGEGFRNLG